jgi:hypothetical protein
LVSGLINDSGKGEILARVRICFAAEPLLLQQSSFGIEISVEKQKIHKWPDTDQIPAELNKVDNTLRSEIHRLFVSFSGT